MYDLLYMVVVVALIAATSLSFGYLLGFFIEKIREKLNERA